MDALIAIFIFWVLSAFVAAAIAGARGRNAAGYFLLGMVISVFAIILAAALPSLKSQPIIVAGEVATPETHVRCPWCKGLVRMEAEICMHCRRTLRPTPRPEPTGLLAMLRRRRG